MRGRVRMGNHATPNTVNALIQQTWDSITHTPWCSGATSGPTTRVMNASNNSVIGSIVTTQTGIGPQTITLPGVLHVTKMGLGEPVLTLAQLDNVPNSSGNYSPYVDVHLSNATGVDALTIVVTYTNETSEQAHGLFYYTGAGLWEPVSDFTVDTAVNTVTFTATAITTPALTDLTGTPFVVGTVDGEAPTAVSLSTINAARPSSFIPLLLILLTAGIGLWLLLIRKTD